MKDNTFLRLKKKLPGLKKNVLLKDHTTFKIGGNAEYFLIVKEKENVIKAIKEAQKFQLPIFIFGGGSNLLVSDKGLRGLVIRIQSFDKSFSTKKIGKNIIVKASGGVELKNLVEFSVNNGLEGLEWAGGLPGTFGGAIRGNAGAFGGEIKDSILEVEALDNSLRLRKLSNRQCKFSYRSSIFKMENWIVLSASVKLQKGSKKNLQEIANSHIDYRVKKHPLEYPNAGSVFKNMDFKKIPLKFQNLFLDKVKKDPFLIVPSAWFVIGAGLAGKKIGRAEVSKKHSNYIVNLGGAKASDVLKLISLVKKKVKEKYKINLEVEVQLVGF